MRTTTTLALLLLLTGALLAARPAEVMRDAYELYQQGEKERAIVLWEGLYKEGYISPALCFNLGNGYYESGRLGRAILFYERALLLQPAQGKVLHNLDLARRQVEGDPLPWPEFSLQQRWRALRGALPSDTWALLGLLCFWAAAGALWWSRRKVLRWPWLLGSAIGFLLALLTGLLAWSATRALPGEYAIVVSEKLSVQVGPDRQSGVVDTIYEGWKVLPVDRIGEWIKVELPDGQEGWAPREDLETL